MIVYRGLIVDERWYSAAEIATYLGVARETVYRWVDAKGLPAHKMGKFWKFSRQEVDAWVRAGEGALQQSPTPQRAAP